MNIVLLAYLKPMRKDVWKTLSGVELPHTIVTPEEINHLQIISQNQRAGLPPYTRGIHDNMYRSRLWTMRQYAGFSSADETNKRFKYLLEQGQKGLSVAFDLPTQLGIDADNELAFGEVGKVGVSISSVEDMKELFDGLPLDKVSTSMTINSPAMILLAMYIVAAEEQGISSEQLQGTIQNDILKEYIARGTHVFPPKSSLRLITDIFQYCKTNVPKWNTISISGYHIREAGSTAVQELAFTLANAIEYLDAAIGVGLSVDDVAPRVSFFFNCHNDFFEEISKFRAARTLWHDIVTQRYAPKNKRSTMLRFHTQVAGVSLTAQQPLNNISRVTIQALAAILGGTQSLHTNSYDEALGLPTEASATVALRTQQILAEESGVADVVDPLGGSYHVELLTHEMYTNSKKIIDEILEMGGALKAIEAGWQQKEIHLSAYKYLKEIEEKSRHIVGVNFAEMKEEQTMPTTKINAQLQDIQTEKLRTLRETRDHESVQKILTTIQAKSSTNENLFPLVIEAVRLRATLGEIMDAMKVEFGEYSAPSGF